MKKLLFIALTIPASAMADMNAFIDALTRRTRAETRFLNEATITQQLAPSQQDNIALRAMMRDLQHAEIKRSQRNESYVYPRNYYPNRGLFGQTEPQAVPGNRRQFLDPIFGSQGAR